MKLVRMLLFLTLWFAAGVPSVWSKWQHGIDCRKPSLWDAVHLAWSQIQAAAHL